MGFWFGFDTGFDIMRVFVFAIFAIVIVCFIALAVKGIGTWHKNNNSPRLTVQAAVVASGRIPMCTTTAITTAVCTPAPPLTIT